MTQVAALAGDSGLDLRFTLSEHETDMQRSELFSVLRSESVWSWKDFTAYFD